MEEEWIGKAVSIKCDESLGIFQGTIKNLSGSHITIVRAFRNGVPIRKQDAEVVLSCKDILKIELVNACLNVDDTDATDSEEPISVRSEAKETTSTLTNKITKMKISNEKAKQQHSPPTSDIIKKPTTVVASQSSTSILNLQKLSPSTDKFFKQLSQSAIKTNGQKISPPSGRIRETKVLTRPNPQKLSPSTDKFFKQLSNGSMTNGQKMSHKAEKTVPIQILQDKSLVNEDLATVKSRSCSKPIDITSLAKSAPVNNMTSCNNENGSNVNAGKVIMANKQKKKPRRAADFNLLQTFGTPINDPIMSEDFDFEGNLALFDKRAIWNTIESTKKPNSLKNGKSTKKKTYRVDENILTSEPLELRQIECLFQKSGDFVTDEGLIIPSIPIEIRTRIQRLSAAAGLSLLRQNDILARGTTEVALMLLGGSRRLIPNNRHQWPTIAIICNNMCTAEMGAATGRQIASHGLKVVLQVLPNDDEIFNERNSEIQLFEATGNQIVTSVTEMPSPDLVILSIDTTSLPETITKWLAITRASILAIDPPANGIDDIQIKCSIFPILPLNHLSRQCGKIYLCNLGIPSSFYRESGILYKSPFGHKFVIQIYHKD